MSLASWFEVQALTQSVGECAEAASFFSWAENTTASGGCATAAVRDSGAAVDELRPRLPPLRRANTFVSRFHWFDASPTKNARNGNQFSTETA
jgi:hypothetical protein